MSMRFPIAVAVFCICLCLAPPSLADGKEAFDHSAWDRIVQTCVNDQGKVAYKSLAAKDRATLEEYLQRVARADASKMPPKEALAFYVNAYNAAAFKGVLEGGTAESVLSRLKFFRTRKYKIAGEEVNLDDLEQKIIRPRFKDARVHFALVCASGSCPKLARKAYTADELDVMLERAGKEFLADRFRNPLGQGSEVKVSMIFKWYAEDFVRDAGSVQTFIAKYAGPSGPSCLQTNVCKLQHVDYDWTLNAQEGQRP